MLQFDLAGCKALVIGAAGGVGLAIARRLATSGHVRLVKAVESHSEHDISGYRNGYRVRRGIGKVVSIQSFRCPDRFPPSPPLVGRSYLSAESTLGRSAQLALALELSENVWVARASKKTGRGKRPGIKPVTYLTGSFLLATTARPKKKVAATKSSESARVLVKKFGTALRAAGISRSDVFPPDFSGQLHIYSVDPTDPSRTIRRSRDGESSVGRFVGGRFKSR